ncbi:hypothetical protein ABI59_17860 [Acidobacteria bacterium Mor1]|nr:hypothetical protein ABI59_17860 [Acidobacteria bacterium Mor1]
MKIHQILLIVATLLIAGAGFAGDADDRVTFHSTAPIACAEVADAGAAFTFVHDPVLELSAPYTKKETSFCDGTGDCTSKSCKTSALIVCPAGQSKRNVNCSVKDNKICASDCKCFCSWECHPKTMPVDPWETEDTEPVEGAR